MPSSPGPIQCISSAGERGKEGHFQLREELSGGIEALEELKEVKEIPERITHPRSWGSPTCDLELPSEEGGQKGSPLSMAGALSRRTFSPVTNGKLF